MKKSFVLMIVFTFIFGGTNLFAQKSDLLVSLQSRFAEINDLSADFKQLVNGSTKMSGKIYYKKNNKIRLELKDNVIVSNGETNWNYNKKTDKLIISDYDPDADMLSIEKIVNEYPEKCNVTALENENERKLSLIPTSRGLGFSKAELWITTDNLIEKVVVENKGKGSSTILLSGYTLNSGLQDSKFNYSPSEGTKVVDLR